MIVAAILLFSFDTVWLQTVSTRETEEASTLSSQHRLLSDLYERLNDLGPGVVRIRKDRKKIKELQDELARQVSLIKDRPFNEVPKKMQLVTDAIQMLLKYPTGISSVTETTDADAPKKMEHRAIQVKARRSRMKCVRLRDTMPNLSDEQRDEMMRSFMMSESDVHKIRRCGVFQKEVASKHDRKRCDDYTELLKKMNLAMSGNKNE